MKTSSSTLSATRAPRAVAAAASLALAGALLGAPALAGAQDEGREQARPAAPKIYKYFKDGVPSFSDIAPSKGPYVVYNPYCYACSVESGIDWHSTRLHLDEYTAEIDGAARQFDLDPALVRAVIHAESGFNARARSPKGASGLMQLMPGTARQLGVTDVLAPSHNIRGGAKYLAGLLARFRNDVTLATAAYNAGPEAVQKYAGIPPYAETRVYVQRVRILHQRYRDSRRG